MAGAFHQPDQREHSLDRWRQQKARRRLYQRRRLVLILLLLSATTLVYMGVRALALKGPGNQSPDATAKTEPLAFVPELVLQGPDLDGDGKPEQVAVSPATDFLRKVALVTGSKGAYRVIGQVKTVQDFPLKLQDLPRGKNVLVMEGKLESQGAPKEVLVGKDKAMLAAGGEPNFKAWQLDLAKGLVEGDYYTLAAPTPKTPTQLLVDKWLNVLWYYENGELVMTSRVATGRHLTGPSPSEKNQAENFVTPLGTFTIGYKKQGMAYYKGNIPAGDPRNPLGTRFLGFSVYTGDGASVWAIHGTDKPELIGRWASDGCIRLSNSDVEKLYDRVKEGTVLEIVHSQVK